MDSQDSTHRRSQTTNSIPLQDLPRPPEDDGAADSSAHRRALSARLLGSSYTSRDEHARDSSWHHPTDLDPEQHLSPQERVGFAGISFGPSSDEDFLRPTLPHGSVGLGTLLGQNDSELSLASVSLDDRGREDSPPVEADSDRTPLTNARFIQPIDGATGEQRSQRPSFAEPPRSPGGGIFHGRSRLGDELNAAELGAPLSPTRGRSSSVMFGPSSPLGRASTVVRKMSQRVVNLSNEPELVEQEIRRRGSQRRSGEDGRVDSGHAEPPSPASEKPPKPVVTQVTPTYSHDWVRHANPLRGKSLGVFPRDSRLRTTLCDFLTHPFMEPAILALIVFQTVLLAVQDAPDYFQDPDTSRWNNSWIDFTLLALFVIYTIEAGMRVIVSGFIVNPVEYSTINRQEGIKQAVTKRAHALFALERQPSVKKMDTSPSAEPLQPSIFRAFTATQGSLAFTVDSRHTQRVRLTHRAFLRHSFNRLDFLAVLSYWIAFVMSITGAEDSKHVHAFRMLSCLRILRLLSLTSGTSMILRSLKKAAPLLLNVALLIGFFWLIFAIIGVQSFKSSLRRSCFWSEPGNPSNNYTSNVYGSFQFCGGSVDADGTRHPWQYANGASSNDIKGYLCPPNAVCISDSNPYNGTVSFDNIFQSLELVFVIITSNTFTDIMYYTTDTDYLPAAIYFALGIVILTFWLMNLLTAVITSSFQVIRDESKTSAFSTEDVEEAASQQDDQSPSSRRSKAKALYDRSFWFWIAVILYGIVVQCLRSASMSSSREAFINDSETVVTFFLLVEICIRFAVDWRWFFWSRKNWFDLSLAVITIIIQIPPIRSSGQPYAWLSIFQIMRIYRVVLAIPWTRDLLLLVLGKTSGFLNLILFVFLLTFLVAILASQLFRGELPQTTPNGQQINVAFNTIFNCFLGMYQVFSSENWTTLLYNVTSNDVYYDTAWIGAIFFILWFILGFYIVLNMFIAVIQENFDVSEDEKRMQQVKAFLQQKELGGSSHGTLSLSSMFKLRSLFARRQDPLDFGPAMTEMLLEDAIVKDFLDDNTQVNGSSDHKGESNGGATNGASRHSRHLSTPNPATLDVRDLVTGSWYENIRMRFFKRQEVNPFYSRFNFTGDYADLDPQALAKEVVLAAERRKLAQREYLIKHPSYNTSLFIFKPNNPIRRLCQKMVGPSRGTDRIEGASPSPILLYAFSAFLYTSIVAMVVLACVTTPLFQKNYWANTPYSVRNWFVFTDMAFALLFTVEGAVRIIADGFFWTPNAYFRSTWGIIDGIVLITLWINVLTSLYNQGAVSRAVGAFKALRALRLLNVSDSARNTFHSVIVLGGWKVLSAAFVSISLLIPFAIYGLNLFNGQMEGCNDGNSNIVLLSNCVNEYMSSPTNWNVLAPRVVSNSWYSFDNFGASLSILFQIVSQEGWVDVMWRAISITGRGTQLENFNTYGNAVFFVVFNLLGAVFVLTLFVSVFMRNYTEQTGVAFLTTEQRSWLELRKLLRQVSPSKRPPAGKQRQTWQQWCYIRSIRKTGKWQRFYTAVLIVHLILLCSESYPEPDWWATTRVVVFFVMVLFYIVNIALRIVGLTWTRFRKSSWDLYSLIVVSATFVMTIVLFTKFSSRVYIQLHKLLLVSIVFLLIPRNNQLDQLFKTAAASFTAIGNLLATWFVLFLVYSIAFTQTFSLTRFGGQESDNLNFRDVPKALIVLFRCSVGEGWDQIMQDYASIELPFCTEDPDNFLNSDCGSASWSKALFISWNILSMYIFVNMFISLIYESFSYVYQRSSGLSAISRKEIRRFKQAWAEYDPDGSGFISKDAFPRFLGELSGVFDMSIYPETYKVGYLKQTCGKIPEYSARYSALPLGAETTFDAPQDMDIDLLNERLDRLPTDEVRIRRMRLNVFYEEVMVSADPDRGISFTSLLLILAHYKVINDNKSLRLEEYLRRRARLQRVEEAVRRAIVIGFFDTLYWRRKFRKHMREKYDSRVRDFPALQVPEIFVEDQDATDDEQELRGHSKKPSLTLQIPGSPGHSPGVSATDFSSEHGHASGYDPRPPGGGLRNRADSIQISPVGPVQGAGLGESAGGSANQWATHSPTARLSTSATLFPQPLGTSSGGLQPERGPSLDTGRDGMSNHNRGLSVEQGHRGHTDEGSSQGQRSRANSNVSAQDLMNMIDNSAWGESMRRSFTTKGTKKGARSSGTVSKSGPRD